MLRPREDFYRHAQPRPDNGLLLIEVADTSVRFDREVKNPLYGKHQNVWGIHVALTLRGRIDAAIDKALMNKHPTDFGTSVRLWE